MSSVYSIPLVNNNKPILADLGFYGDIRFDVSDLLPNYIGLNVAQPASADATDWKVYKFTYDGSNNATRIQVAYGSWTNRASLIWT